MDAQWYPLLSGVFGLAVGAAISWQLARSRQRKSLIEGPASTLQVSALLQVELSSLKGRASRIPELESQLAARAQALNAANERKAMLETEIQRLLDLEGTRASAALKLAAASRTIAVPRDHLGTLTAELAADQDALAALRSELRDSKSRYEAKVGEAASQVIELAELRKSLDNERAISQEKLALHADAKHALVEQFTNLASDILEEKSKRLTEQNQTNLGTLLDPLKRRILEFQTNIEDTYIKEGNCRTALREQMQRLMELNQHLREDAKDLARALRESRKAQDSWGELVLKRVLEGSGLRKGEEIRSSKQPRPARRDHSSAGRAEV